MLSRIARTARPGVVVGRLSQLKLTPSLRSTPAAALASPVSRPYATKKDGASNQWTKKQPPSSASASSPKSQPRADTSRTAPTPGQKDSESAEEKKPTPFHELPDLTQGIPSTLDGELRRKAGRSQSALEPIESEEDAEGRERRERPEYVSTSDRNRKWWTRFVLLSAAAGGTFAVLYMGREWDDAIEAERHRDVPNGWSPMLWWQRARARMGESVSYYQDPAFDKLLPDPDPSFERPYTLCISLDDLLVHSEWSRDHGWRVAKRPGMDYFVRYLSQYYELVLFTSVPFAMGEPIVRKLDPFRFIMWPLYREATKYEDGEIVKVRCPPFPLKSCTS